MRIPVVIVTAIVAAGCGRGAAETADAGVPADSSCDFVRVPAHSSADSLAAEFVERDARGEFTRSNAWFDGAVTCAGHEPGPDEATMVKGYRIVPLKRTGDSAAVEVRWDALSPPGDADALDPHTEFDTLQLIHTSFGWRVESPALNPHTPVPPRPRLPQ